MPGLNCGADTLYYDYIKSTSSNIDIYILVVDVNSALNTTDEINIIRLIIEEIKKNKNGYIHILINNFVQMYKKKIRLEYAVRTSPALLFNYISSPSGLSNWFCSDVDVYNNQFKFKWDSEENIAESIKKVNNK